MQLRLHRPPTATNAPLFAADTVVAAEEISGVRLDYSVDSLEAVDAIIGQMRGDGCTSSQIAETLFVFGCYVGEVFVRQANGQWRDAAGSPMDGRTRFPMVVELPDGAYCNPIGKVFKRLDNGEADNLPQFFRAFTRSG